MDFDELAVLAGRSPRPIEIACKTTSGAAMVQLERPIRAQGRRLCPSHVRGKKPLAFLRAYCDGSASRIGDCNLFIVLPHVILLPDASRAMLPAPLASSVPAFR